MAVRFNKRQILFLTAWTAAWAAACSSAHYYGGWLWSPYPVRFTLFFAPCAALFTVLGRQWTGVAIGTIVGVLGAGIYAVE